MPFQRHVIGLQTGCMVTVLVPVVEAARLPRVCPMALGYGLPPCDNNNDASCLHVEPMYISTLCVLNCAACRERGLPQWQQMGVLVRFELAGWTDALSL